MGFPVDWPKPGPINLDVQDLPHRSSALEWWYVNSHLRLVDGRDLSIFAAFFRMQVGNDEKTGEPNHAHAITWAVSDPSEKVYYRESRLDPSAPHIALERLRRGAGSQDPRLNRAMIEALERGKIPLPDRCFSGEVRVDLSRLDLDFGGSTLRKLDDGSYSVHLRDGASEVGCDLVFTPQKIPVRHGEDGVIRAKDDEGMFYYFIPRCDVKGSVLLKGEVTPIASGQGWYDHEFGGDITGKHHRDTGGAGAGEVSSSAKTEAAWNWVAVQLDDGRDISAYSLCDAVSGDRLHQWAIISDATGGTRAYQDFRLEPTKWWRSVRTFTSYPVQWRLVIPELELDVTLEADFPDQEFVTFLSDPAFWEGSCSVSGSRGAQVTKGRGYIERSGFQLIRTLDDFFSSVGEVVRESVGEVLPMSPTLSQAVNLIASPERAYYLEGVDLDQLSRTLIKPIREIVDRGGKSWRSYAAMVCCDVVGGDSRQYTKWLAMPELMHVGSLIVDDVQDKADVRRGGPACHLIFGEPLALNAGTAAYFLGQKLLKSDNVTAETQLKMYDLYFEALRAGHGGQALDLDGLSQAMQQALDTDDTSLLEQRVLATYRLKTAAPAGTLARMGALVGGGTDAQVDAIGRFFEALGLAFQIVDDVLNLRGFAGDLKSIGEDVGNGTITFPVAKAMARLCLEDRLWLRDTLASKPKDNPPIVESVIQKLEGCGAIQACSDHARGIVESAWKNAEPFLDESLSKVMLRAFGWYVLDRHY